MSLNIRSTIGLPAVDRESVSVPEFLTRSLPQQSKVNPRISDYILSLFNREAGSDFIFECDGRKTYLHKWILRRNPYFVTLFDTPIGHTSAEEIDRTNIIFDPEEYPAAVLLAKSIYCDKFSRKEMINHKIDVLTCISLAKEWMIDGLVWTKLIKILTSQWCDLVNKDIYNVEMIYILTEKSLIDRLTPWMNGKVEFLPENASSWSSFKMLNSNNVLAFHYKYQHFDVIEKERLSLDSLAEVMQAHSEITLKRFSPHAISSVFRSKTCGWTLNISSIDHRSLHVNSLIPFSAEYFVKVATVVTAHTFKDDDVEQTWLLLQVEDDFTRQDILILEGMALHKVMLRDPKFSSCF